MPRLFVAINFSSAVTDNLYNCVQYLRQNSKNINPSRKENLHLTLAFIGETNNIRGAVAAMKELSSAPFDLTIEGFSQFSSKDGSICFAKAKECNELLTLAENLRKNLTQKGFSIDTKPFKPHITLCRQFVPSGSFCEEEITKLISSHHLTVREIFLMRSDRIGGKLVYTQVHKKLL